MCVCVCERSGLWLLQVPFPQNCVLSPVNIMQLAGTRGEDRHKNVVTLETEIGFQESEQTHRYLINKQDGSHCASSGSLSYKQRQVETSACVRMRHVTAGVSHVMTCGGGVQLLQ